MAAPIIQKPAKYWFADDYKGSTIDPDIGVIHTTEGTSLPWYGGGATAPTATGLPDFTQKRLVWTQHFPDTMSARALRNESGGVQTNTQDCIQIELVGTCDKATSDSWKKAGRAHIYWPAAPQWALDEVAEFVAYQYRVNKIRVEGPEQIGESFRAYPASYGKSASQRFSFDQWRNFKGWCGHQHVPENSHGDPGNINWSYIETKAKAILFGPGKPTTPPGTTPKPPTEELTVSQYSDLKAQQNRIETTLAAFIKSTGDRWAQGIEEQRNSDDRNAIRSEADRLRDVEQDEALADIKALVQGLVDDPDSPVTATDVQTA